jgi:hypothetical protein
MAAAWPPVAYDAMEEVLSDDSFQAPDPPVSCAATMARELGASEMRATTAAGLAGGIGLSGGGCGALGTAIWLHGLKSGEPLSYQLSDPRVEAIVTRFLESSDYEFECTAIVGRRFEDVADHASYLRDGGCSGLFESMSSGQRR